ncbi:hypothetical protein ACS0TY_019491 [Phlomoides rotata]
MSFLKDPADVVRASAVSPFWRQFVITNGFAKRMCLKVFPELSIVGGSVIESRWAMSSAAMKSENFEIDHMVYASLLRIIKKWDLFPGDCIFIAISVSSAEHFPTIGNTLTPKDIFMGRLSYWSSIGHVNPEVHETLIYRLKTRFSVITEININPFEASFQLGNPIYLAKSVRFRMGHPKSRKAIINEREYLPFEKRQYVWTYTSHEFTMNQENKLQQFRLPKPALCVRGYVQIELLGMVQRQETDGLFYLRLNHVRVLGCSLFPAFDVEIDDPSGKILLQYSPKLVLIESVTNQMFREQWARVEDKISLWERMGYPQDPASFEGRRG